MLACPTTQAPMNRGLKHAHARRPAADSHRPTTQAPMNRGLKLSSFDWGFAVIVPDNPSPDE